MHIQFEKKDSIGWVIFNRPEVLNALNQEVLKDLSILIDEIKAMSDLRVLIFTGAGKAFIAGADIKEMSSFTPEMARAFSEKGQEIFNAIEQLDVVTLAAINGFALGGGCELAMACDIRIASDRAKLGQPEVTLGITPGFSGTQRLSRLVGKAKAKELIFTGKIISAEEAEKIGLVNQVTDDVTAAAQEMAEIIAKQAPLAVKYSKKAIDRGLEVSIESGNLMESTAFGMSFSTKDQVDGMKAFLNKSKADFQGK